MENDRFCLMHVITIKNELLKDKYENISTFILICIYYMLKSIYIEYTIINITFLIASFLKCVKIIIIASHFIYARKMQLEKF